MTTFDRLVTLAHQWGGQFIHVTSESFWRGDRPYKLGLSKAPFDPYLAIEWDRMEMWFADPDPGPIIHEMAHLFACQVPPEHADEFDFFGWEYALARKVRGVGEWMKSNREYGIAPDQEFGTMTKRQRKQVLDERLDYAQALGILDGLNPIPIRRGRDEDARIRLSRLATGWRALSRPR